MQKLLTGFLALAMIISVAWKCYEYYWYLSFLPKELKVWKIVYMETDASGFGPGAAATGIIVYDLPEEMARVINDEGIGYLNSLDRRLGDPKHEITTWAKTPIEVTLYWTDYMSDDGKGPLPPSIENYLNAYGFGIPVEKSVVSMADDAIKKKGSFYAYGRNSVFIIIPSEKAVIMAYNH